MIYAFSYSPWLAFRTYITDHAVITKHMLRSLPGYSNTFGILIWNVLQYIPFLCRADRHRCKLLRMGIVTTTGGSSELPWLSAVFPTCADQEVQYVRTLRCEGNEQNTSQYPLVIQETISPWYNVRTYTARKLKMNIRKRWNGDSRKEGNAQVNSRNQSTANSNSITSSILTKSSAHCFHSYLSTTTHQTTEVFLGSALSSWYLTSDCNR